MPDFAYPLGEQAWLYATSAALALIVSLALFRWPRAMAAAIAGSVVSIALWGSFAGTGSTEKPNVLWILIDTTRRDHVSPFGSLAETPAIERLAAQGVLFEDAVTVIPKTPQSVASFFTGRYPIHHGVRTLHGELKESQPSVVKLFKEAGYRTAAFVNNPWLSKDRGFGQGFERYYSTYELGEKYGGVLRYVSWFVLADRLTVKRIETTFAENPEGLSGAGAHVDRLGVPLLAECTAAAVLPLCALLRTALALPASSRARETLRRTAGSNQQSELPRKRRDHARGTDIR